eukprot:9647899-Alexandrium_andersonii.AAC.1
MQRSHAIDMKCGLGEGRGEVQRGGSPPGEERWKLLETAGSNFQWSAALFHACCCTLGASRWMARVWRA